MSNVKYMLVATKASPFTPGKSPVPDGTTMPPDPATPAPAEGVQQHEWAGDLYEQGDETTPDGPEAFGSYAGQTGETAWLDRAPDGTLTGWVRDADQSLYRYSDADAWAIDVDDAGMAQAGMTQAMPMDPNAPADPNAPVDPNAAPVDPNAPADPNTPVDPAMTAPDAGPPVDPNAPPVPEPPVPPVAPIAPGDPRTSAVADPTMPVDPNVMPVTPGTPVDPNAPVDLSTTVDPNAVPSDAPMDEEDPWAKAANEMAADTGGNAPGGYNDEGTSESNLNNGEGDPEEEDVEDEEESEDDSANPFLGGKNKAKKKGKPERKSLDYREVIFTTE